LILLDRINCLFKICTNEFFIKFYCYVQCYHSSSYIPFYGTWFPQKLTEIK